MCGAVPAHGAPAKAETCPRAASDIDTDRPDTTNSSQTVPAPGWTVPTAETWIPCATNGGLFEETLSSGRELDEAADVFVEYVGDCPKGEKASQVFNFGGAWRFTHTQQIDFHAGFGFNQKSPKSYLGLGYAFRFDGQF